MGRSQGVAEVEDVEKLKSELNEMNLVNAKVIYFGKLTQEK